MAPGQQARSYRSWLRLPSVRGLVSRAVGAAVAFLGFRLLVAGTAREAAILTAGTMVLGAGFAWLFEHLIRNDDLPAQEPPGPV